MTRHVITKPPETTAATSRIMGRIEEEGFAQPTSVQASKDPIPTKENLSAQIMMQKRIMTVHEDVKDIEKFYIINFSPIRIAKVTGYLEMALQDLKDLKFSELDQEARVDYLLLQNWLRRNIRDFKQVKRHDEEALPLLSEWTFKLVELCEKRQKVELTDAQDLAAQMTKAATTFKEMTSEVKNGKLKAPKENRSIASRALSMIGELQSHVTELYDFYNGYDPLFSWWMAEPYKKLNQQLEEYSKAIQEHLVGIKEGDEEPIIGDPVGHEILSAKLESEFIPYSPEDILKIGETEYQATMEEMLKASHELGYGKDWHAALEHIKQMYVPPGEQPSLIQQLAHEAISYVKQHDLVTVPPVCEETWRTLMMSPERQKIAPFFLGGGDIQVSYPTSSMSHDDKMMSMRGNSKPFCKATVFHELIPGHHLQYHHIARDRPYRCLKFKNPFWMEGWAMYWEYVLWDRGDFFVTPEDRIGTLFWRLHRCARIIFSVKFHLGKWTSQECIDFLVEKVGHERATAEGEVRRSFSGMYPALYQAGYMLGALQLRELRKEVVDGGKMKEKNFHDQILRANQMPIELLRALLVNRPLDAEYKSSWHFYHSHDPKQLSKD